MQTPRTAARGIPARAVDVKVKRSCKGQDLPCRIDKVDKFEPRNKMEPASFARKSKRYFAFPHSRPQDWACRIAR